MSAAGPWAMASAMPGAAPGGAAARALALLLVAAAAGAAIGLERERKEKPAGLRTMTLVAMGAAAFTLVSRDIEGPGGGRIAAQVVTGVGFLGAGAILRGAHGVTGMTSAATVWSVAAIGMVAGAGHPISSVALATLVIAVLHGVAAIERRYLGPCAFRRMAVTFRFDGGKGAIRVLDLLDEYQVPARTEQVQVRDDGRRALIFTYCAAHRHHREFLPRLANLAGVEEIESDG